MRANQNRPLGVRVSLADAEEERERERGGGGLCKIVAENKSTASRRNSLWIRDGGPVFSHGSLQPANASSRALVIGWPRVEEEDGKCSSPSLSLSLSHRWKRLAPRYGAASFRLSTLDETWFFALFVLPPFFFHFFRLTFISPFPPRFHAFLFSFPRRARTNAGFPSRSLEIQLSFFLVSVDFEERVDLSVGNIIAKHRVTFDRKSRSCGETIPRLFHRAVALKIEIRLDFCIERFSKRIDFHRNRPVSYVLNNAFLISR